MSEMQQGKFFDRKKYQYPSSVIILPPLHTLLEYKRIIKELNNSKEVVDFGCGTGRLTVHLLRNGLTVTSVDLSKKSLRELQKISKKLGFHKMKTLNRLPRNEKFPTIVGCDILHHVDLFSTLQHIHQYLSINGKIAFSEPNAWNISWYIFLPFLSSWEIEKGITQMSYFSIKKALISSGFKNIKIEGLGLFPRPLFNWSRRACLINDMLGNLPVLKLFAYRYIISGNS